MLAGLAAQSLTVSLAATVGTVAFAAGTFLVLLIVASIAVTVASTEWIKPARMVGGGVRRWSGFALIAVGSWFLLLSILPTPIII